jgi:CO dehydrogenase/acetyl-CoA synthase delta subunit
MTNEQACECAGVWAAEDASRGMIAASGSGAVGSRVGALARASALAAVAHGSRCALISAALLMLMQWQKYTNTACSYSPAAIIYSSS